MSEKEKQVEKERKELLDFLLKKNDLKRKELIDSLLGVWVASWVDSLTDDEKKLFPHLAF